MSQYAKLKNDELQAKLRERGLPTTGKKADMVDRLTKDDEKKTAEGAPAPSNAHPEDEIDWDDEDAGKSAASAKGEQPEKTETKESAVVTQPETVTKAGGTGQPPNPQAVPNQKVDIDPSKTDDLSVKPPGEEKEGDAEAEADELKEPAPSYAAGIAATDLDAEIEKRRKRAAKFGLEIKEDDETLKKLERAKKFGESGALKGLDEALPERKERKRGREDNDDGGRNKRRGGGRAGGNRGPREGRDGNRDGDKRRDNRDNQREDRRNDNEGSWMSTVDRERAEARKAKWAKKPAATS